MTNLTILISSILITGSSFLLGYTFVVQETTLWLSKTLIEQGKIPLNGSYKATLKITQTLITPRNQSLRQIILPLLIVTLFVLLFLIHWYFAVIASSIVWILGIFIGAFFSRVKFQRLILIVERDLSKKQLSLKRKNEYEKSLLIENLIILIHHEYIVAKNNNISLNRLR